MSKSRVTTVNVQTEIYDNFRISFPWCFSRFVTRAMYLALKDKKFFERVYFCDIGEL